MKVYLGRVSQSCSLHMLLQSAMYCKYSLKLKGYTKIGCATPDTKKPLKNHSLEVAKKYVDTYSSSKETLRCHRHRSVDVVGHSANTP